LHNADIAASSQNNTNINSQQQQQQQQQQQAFNTSSSGIVDPYQYNQHLAWVNQQRRQIGLPPMAMQP